MHVERPLATLAAAVWLAGCVPTAAPPVAAPPTAAVTPKPSGPPAARVNGHAISREAFSARVEQHMLRYRSGGHQLPPSIELRVRESVLRRMIEDTLLMQEASKLGIAVSNDQLRAAFEEHKRRFRSADAFAEYLKRSHRTEVQVRAELHRDLLRESVVTHLSGQAEVSANEIHSYYAENRSRFVEREQIKASRILIRLPRDAPREREREAQDLAQKLRDEAARNPRSFAELARTHSHGPQAKRGGDLGWFARGRMHPDWDRMAFALEPGSISKPLHTKLGFEIVAVWEHRAERERSLNEATDEIRSTLTARKLNEKRRAVLQELSAQAQVEVLIEIGDPPAD